MDEARKGELSGESESIEVLARTTSHVCLKHDGLHNPFPAGIEPTFKV